MNLLDARRLLMATAHEPRSILPDEYQRVEYVESTGTQYIDTGAVPNATSKLVTTIQHTVQYTSGNHVNGVTNSSGRLAFGFIPGTSQNFVFSIGDKNLDTYTLFDLRKRTFILQGDGYRSVGNVFSKNDVTFVGQATIFIFASNNNKNPGVVNTYSDVRVFDYKLYSNGELVRDFIPCYRKNDGEVGLYDTVEGKFYTNEGTGEFLKGEDV